MRIAVVTGASSGIGREFCRQLDKENDFDEMWVVARREDRLASLSKELKCRVRPVSMDLTSPDSFEKYKALLEEHKPDVAVLVNASGFGKFGKYTDVSPEDEANMIDLNCRAVVLMTRATLPYMREGGQIYQLCSVAAYAVRQPDHQYCVCCGVSAYPVYQRLRRDKGSCSALQPCAQPRAEKAGGACYGGMPVLDKDGVLRPRRNAG